MSELDVVIEKLNTIEAVQIEHGSSLKTLSNAFAKMAVQNEQITSMQGQLNSLWRKNDKLTSPDGTISKIKDHQAHCPKEEMHRTFKWVWGVISIHSGLRMGLFYCLLKD